MQLNKRYSLVVFFTLAVTFSGFSQEYTDLQLHEQFIYKVKQMEQFFGRYNGQQDIKGNDLKEPLDKKTRAQYLLALIDQEYVQENKTLVKGWMQAVVEQNEAGYLKFEDNNWVAAVDFNCTHQGKKSMITLYFRMEQHFNGYAWKLCGAKGDKEFGQVKINRSKDKNISLSTHEMDFMDFTRKMEGDSKNIDAYLSNEYQASHLDHFIAEMKAGHIKIGEASKTSFYIFTTGHVLHVSRFERNSKNAGWLIDQIVPSNACEQLELLEYLEVSF